MERYPSSLSRTFVYIPDRIMANDIVLVSQKPCDQTEDVQSILLSGTIARKSKYGLLDSSVRSSSSAIPGVTDLILSLKS